MRGGEKLSYPQQLKKHYTIQRSSNIELLRIILIVMVLILHINNPLGGAILSNSSGINYYFALFFECLCVCAVDTFVLISGFFGYRSQKLKVGKLIVFILSCIFFKLLSYFVTLIAGTSEFALKSFVSCFIFENWFMLLYIALALFAPLFNCLIRKMTKKTHLAVLLLLGGLFVLVPTAVDCANQFFGKNLVFSFLTNSGDLSGYTLPMFIFLYFLGAYSGKYPSSIKWFWDLLLYFGSAIVIFGITYLLYSRGHIEAIHLDAGLNYNNIFVVIEALSLLLFFSKVKMKSVWLINLLSRATFDVYLFHTTSVIYSLFWMQVLRLDKIATYSFGNFFIWSVIAPLSTYGICVGVSLLSDFVFLPLKNWIMKIDTKIPQYQFVTDSNE